MVTNYQDDQISISLNNTCPKRGLNDYSFVGTRIKILVNRIQKKLLSRNGPDLIIFWSSLSVSVDLLPAHVLFIKSF